MTTTTTFTCWRSMCVRLSYTHPSSTRNICTDNRSCPTKRSLRGLCTGSARKVWSSRRKNDRCTHTDTCTRIPCRRSADIRRTRNNPGRSRSASKTSLSDDEKYHNDRPTDRWTDRFYEFLRIPKPTIAIFKRQILPSLPLRPSVFNSKKWRLKQKLNWTLINYIVWLYVRFSEYIKTYKYRALYL